MKKNIIFLLCALLLLSCEEDASQNPIDSFVNKKLPAILLKMANPTLSAEQEKKALASLKAKKGIRVAVIDNGTDYLHPALINHIDYKIENGKIVGAGFDVMGNSAWPHPALIEPKLFSFGANSVTKDGLIDGPLENPLELLAQMEEEFGELFDQAIKENPILQKTLFRRMNSNNVNFLTFAQQVDYHTEDFLNTNGSIDRFGFKIKEYKKLKEEKKLFNFNFLKQKDLTLEDKLLFEKIAHGNIRLGRETLGNLIFDYTSYEKLEGADEFMRVLEEVYSTIENKYDFQRHLKNYKRYTKLRRLDTFNPAVTDLNELVSRYRFPGLNDYNIFKESILGELYHSFEHKDLTYLHSKTHSTKQKIKYIEKSLKKWSEISKKGLNLKIDDEFTNATDKESFQNIIKDMDKRHQYILDQLKKEPMILSLMLDGELKYEELLKITNFKSFSNYDQIVNHPYLHHASSTVSHGTHVSGTIMAQDNRLKIHPVRVMTSTTSRSKAQLVNLKQKMYQDFSKFMTNDHTLLAILNNPSFAKLLAGKVDVDTNDPIELANIKEEIKKVLKEIILDKPLGDNKLDIEFFDQIIEAIRHVGKQKIKVASISLGSSFEDVTDQINPNDLLKSKQDFVKFMTYEYFKDSVAREIEESAPHTLFSVAAGNDSKWVDARARSALPNDLSSPFFKSIEKETGLISPSNRVKNILSVGSVGRDGYLTAFTNLIISDVPYVLSLGENVESSIRETDNHGATQEFHQKYGTSKNGFPGAVSAKDIQKMGLLSEGLDSADRHTEKYLKYSQANFMTYTSFSYYNTQRISDYCVSSKVCHAQYNGTSMATPHMSGLIGKHLTDKMIALGLAEEQIYGHPDFTPERIIKEMMAKGKPYPEGRIKNITTHLNLKEYKRVEKVPLGDRCHIKLKSLLK